MAFVPPTGSNLRLSSFTQRAIESSSPKRAVSVGPKCMADEKDDSPAVGIQGKSLWKENVFAGGFPGGEAFFKKWIDGGMMGDVPDMPKKMQASAAFKPQSSPPKGGVLGRLEKIEFFKNLPEATESGSAEDGDEAGEGTGAENLSAPLSPALDDMPPEGILDDEVPDELLYERFYPKATRFLAPDILFDNPNGQEYYRRVGMRMVKVVASPIDVYFAKERKNHAPVIEINYPGSVTKASVRVTMREIEPLPTLPPTPAPGDAITTLEPGSGGGLKLNYAICGGDKIPL